MTKDQALRNLNSLNVDSRLEAARFFSRSASDSDCDAINNALKVERVPWIRRALELALMRADSGGVELFVPEIPEGNLSSFTDRDIKAIKSKIIEEVTGTILHEFGAIISVIGMHASREVPNYNHSDTSLAVNRLVEVLAGIESLKAVAKSPSFSRFILKDLIDDVVLSIREKLGNIDIQLAGPSVMAVVADRNTLRIALSNGLTNAVESVQDYSRLDPPQIVMNWGNAGAEVFVTIHDSGRGLTITSDSAFKIGTTSKSQQNHIGFGLSIAESAIQAMDGEVQLYNATDGGAIFELRWYKENENIND